MSFPERTGEQLELASQLIQLDERPYPWRCHPTERG